MLACLCVFEYVGISVHVYRRVWFACERVKTSLYIGVCFTQVCVCVPQLSLEL